MTIISFTSCYKQIGGEDIKPPVVIGPVSQDDNLSLGNPSEATSNVVNSTNYLMVKKQYALSYNNTKLTANWVSWHLSTAWIGTVNRQDDFRADITLPSTWYSVSSSDFSGSGFDRGHLCPSADRTVTVSDNSSTFLMTNMIPQAPNNNQKVWADFESYCRTLASKGYELYIIAGPYGEGGSGSKGDLSKIGSHGIVVPQYTWKVVLVLLNGNDDVNRVSKTTRTIGIWMPNNQTVSSLPWYKYRVSVDFIEGKTGFDFFSSVPKEIQDAIEAKVDAISI